MFLNTWLRRACKMTTSENSAPEPSTPAAPVGGLLWLADVLTPREANFWPHANKRVLWGWKRDHVLGYSRATYFSGVINATSDGVFLDRAFFFYRHASQRDAVYAIATALEGASKILSRVFGRTELRITRKGAWPVVCFSFGIPDSADSDRISRLLMRRPRRRLVTDLIPTEAPLEHLRDIFPVDAYLGSGVSYEAGLPTLCEIHDRFCLDDHAGCFTFGHADKLPFWLRNDPLGTVRSFCDLHTKAITAEPSEAQRIIASLWRDQKIRNLFSDNVDNLLCKVDVPFERTRGSGVFNERFQATFKTNTLLVVGVAADRRQIIQQARARKMRVVVVDPCARVSHGVQHLNFMRKGDTFFRCTAHQFFTALQAQGEG